MRVTIALSGASIGRTITALDSTRYFKLASVVTYFEALKYVTTLANLKYRVESSAVIVLPIDAPESAMVTRIYPVNPGAFRASVEVTNYTAVTTQTQQTGGGGAGAAQASPAVQS